MAYEVVALKDRWTESQRQAPGRHRDDGVCPRARPGEKVAEEGMTYEILQSGEYEVTTSKYEIWEIFRGEDLALSKCSLDFGSRDKAIFIDPSLIEEFGKEECPGAWD